MTNDLQRWIDKLDETYLEQIVKDSLTCAIVTRAYGGVVIVWSERPEPTLEENS